MMILSNPWLSAAGNAIGNGGALGLELAAHL
jgi:hypothetical protein